ncbi:MAG: transcriptional repressor LexA [Lachnospiraceae bacterium]|nr:transcriptional repressor LexA [Lachnospiraceae bacterium]
MAGKISAKQQEILDFIKEAILERGYPPSVREICDAVHLRSTSTVHAHLSTLEKNGYIRRDSANARAIEIPDDDFRMLRTEMANIPVVGNVAAGEPILAEENIEGYFPFPIEYMSRFEGRDLFMLHVRGDSMIEIGIMDGDQVIVEKQSTAHNGEIVVALIEDGATVKRFYKEDGYIRLQPENSSMEPIIVSDCEILGKVIAMVRTDIH